MEKLKGFKDISLLGFGIVEGVEVTLLVVTEEGLK